MYYNELFIFTTTNRPGHSSARPMAHTMTTAAALANAAFAPCPTPGRQRWRWPLQRNWPLQLMEPLLY